MKLLRVIPGMLLGAAVIVAVAVFALTALGIARFVPVLSNSMAPEMPTGSLAIVVPAPQGEIAVGDVIVFTDPLIPGLRIIHRVASVYPEAEAAELNGWQPGMLALTTKGDNNEDADPWILTIADASVWRRVEVLPLLGWPTIWFGDPRTRMLLFGVGGALIVAWLLALIWRRPEAAAAPAEAAAVEPHEMPLAYTTRRERRTQEASRGDGERR